MVPSPTIGLVYDLIDLLPFFYLFPFFLITSLYLQHESKESKNSNYTLLYNLHTITMIDHSANSQRRKDRTIFISSKAKDRTKISKGKR